METSTRKIKITMNGQEIFSEEGMSILAAARENHIHIPTLCDHPALSAYGGCRLCMVEVDGSPRLVASCVTPVRDGMEIVTTNEKIIQSRRTILEFLFAERNHHCMVCPESGDCELQRLAYELQMDHLTVPALFDTFPMDVTSPYMSFDHNRCVLCGRCVRACREISGARVLNFIHRGPDTLIGFDFNTTRDLSTCRSCGVCLQTCPTGAIVNRYRSHYSVKGHDKNAWQKIDSCCPLCGLLCPVTATVSSSQLLKVEGILDNDPDRPDRGQLCARGRFEVLKTKGQRLILPQVRNKEGIWEKTDWQTAVDLVAEKFNMIHKTHGKNAILGMASSMCANESLLQFKDLMLRGWGSCAMDTLDGDHFRTLLKVRHPVHGPWQETSWKAIPAADFILVVGVDLGETHPVIGSLIQKTMFENKTTVAMIGSSSPVLPLISYHLRVNQTEEFLLIKTLLKEVVESIPGTSRTGDWNRVRDAVQFVDPATIGHPLDVNGTHLVQLQELAKAYAMAVNPLIVTGEGVTGSRDASGLKDLIDLAILKQGKPENRLGIIVLKPLGNSAGAWQMEIPSTEAFDQTGNWKGGLLLLSGEENLARVVPGPVSGVDFLAVISPFFPMELSRKADILLPGPTWMEEAGTYTALDGRESLLKPKLFDPPEGIRSTKQLLSALAERTGFIQA